MNENNNHLDDIRTIRKIMEESTRFLSISGLSGVFMGLIAIAGAVIAKLIIPVSMINGKGYTESLQAHPDGGQIMMLLIADAVIVLILALAVALLFSIRKTLKQGKKLWTSASKKLLLNLVVPLAAGGLFIILTIGSVPGYVSASLMLVFYGVALINASKFTFGEIYWLGIAEIITGMVCLAFPGHSLWFWMFGFGILHIFYGLLMHFRYGGR
ncbi:MAG: hypothetical protein R6W67_00065 [Bacteroidales bacterium]